MFIDSHVSSNKVLLGLWPQKSSVGSEVELFPGWQLVGESVHGEQTVSVGPQHGSMLLMASIHGAGINKCCQLVDLLSDISLTDWS